MTNRVSGDEPDTPDEAGIRKDEPEARAWGNANDHAATPPLTLGIMGHTFAIPLDTLPPLPGDERVETEEGDE